MWRGTKDLSRLPRSRSATCGQKRLVPLAKRSTCIKSTAGYLNKNSNNRKIVSARGTIGREKTRELPLFLPPVLPRALTFFLLPSLPYDTKRPLRRRKGLGTCWQAEIRHLIPKNIRTCLPKQIKQVLMCWLQ